MTQSVRRLQILLQAKNQASGEIQQVQSALGGLGQSLKALGPVALALAAGLAALKLGQTAFEMGRATSASLRLADSFENLAESAGTSGRQMLAALREASQGTIDDTALIGAANRAMLLGVADSSQEMAQLLEVAGARARAMGLTTEQAFSDLVTGLGRMSPQILDNLGIVIDGEAAYKRYAASLGIAADKLDDTQRKQALVNEVIRTSSGLLEANAGKGRDMAASFERMDASLANAKDALGALFTPAAARIAELIADAADSAGAGPAALGRIPPGPGRG